MKKKMLRYFKIGLIVFTSLVLLPVLIFSIWAFMSPISFVEGQKAAKLKLQEDGQSLSAALEQYQAEFEKLPSEEQGMRALVEKPTAGNVSAKYKPLVKSKKDILDPWKTEYKLRFDSNGTYSIISLGKDGKEGGEGMNKDFNILKEEEYPSDPASSK